MPGRLGATSQKARYGDDREDSPISHFRRASPGGNG